MPSDEEIAHALVDVSIDATQWRPTRAVGEVVRPAEQNSVQRVAHFWPRLVIAGHQQVADRCRPAQALLALQPTGSLSRPRRPLSRGSGPSGHLAEPLVSYQINRQFSGWIPPPLVIHAFGAHCHFRTSRRTHERQSRMTFTL